MTPWALCELQLVYGALPGKIRGTISKVEVEGGIIIPKLSTACYAVRLMFHISNTDTLKSTYFAYFHSIMNYGNNFLWSLSQKDIFW
jgi:hypothetical protein